MSSKAKAAGIILSGTLAVAAVPGAQVALAYGEGQDASDAPSNAGVSASDEASSMQLTRHVMLDNVEGVFAWNQEVDVVNATLSRMLYEGSRYLCEGETPQGLAENSSGVIENIEVKGDVANSFVANVAEFNKKAPITKILGCTCKGNPANGRASANAEVAGFMLKALVEQAQPLEGVNAITFVAQDGYEVTLPYKYVMQRYSIIVSQVNGEDAIDAIGCSNQLWLGSTSARAFARNIVAIEFSIQDEDPAVPQTPNLNQPNVGVQAGESLS